jgi:hypothetical protein
MNLNTIKPRNIHTSFRCICKFLDSLLDLAHSHRSGWRIRIFGASDRFPFDWNIRGTQSRITLDQGRYSRASDMPDLTIDESSFGMNSACNTLPSGKLAGCENTGNSGITTALRYLSILLS